MSEFSFFPDIRLGPTATHTLDDVYDLVSGGRYQPEVEKVRAGMMAKTALPAWTISGIFKDGHRKEQLVKPSGYLVIDLDDLDNAEEVRDWHWEQPSCTMAFISARGRGVAAIHVYETLPFTATWKEHDAHHKAVFDHFQNNLYEGKADPSGSDITRLRFASWDPPSHDLLP